MGEFISHKKFYEQPLKLNENIQSDLQKDCYSVFACRHKFCREICPVYSETRNESYSSYGLHTALLSVSEGLDNLANVANTFSYCLECGACELRCPTTLFAGDFYKRTTTTLDLVRKVRRDLKAEGVTPDGWEEVDKYINEHLQYYEGPDEVVTKWANDLNLSTSKNKTVLFVDYFNAIQTTEVSRLAAKILKYLGCDFSILSKPAVSNGELFESNLDLALEHARENIAKLADIGAEKVVFINPHEYSYFSREYPKYLGSLPFEVVFITDFILEILKDKDVDFKPVDMTVSYHDPCALNKLSGVWESPRKLIGMIPGVKFADEDPVTQWAYCCGNGTASFKKVHPEVSYKIGQKRLRSAADCSAETLIVACPHCKDQLTEVKTKSGINVEPKHLLEVMAESLGIEK